MSKKSVFIIVTCLLLCTFAVAFTSWFLHTNEATDTVVTTEQVDDAESESVVDEIEPDIDIDETVDDSESDESDEAVACQTVNLGSVSFQLSNLYTQTSVENPFNGFLDAFCQYDSETGLVVFGSKSDKWFSEPKDILSLVENQLIDLSVYEPCGESTQTLNGPEWTLRLYKTSDETNGSLVACTHIDGQVVCVFWHGLWTETSETEFVELLSSMQN